MPLVYDELKKLAAGHLRREGRARPLETTALVHEAFLRLAHGQHPSYENRAHFYGIASRLMRQVLVDHARRVRSEKRGGGNIAATLFDSDGAAWQLDERLLAVDEALSRLEALDPRAD